MNNTIQINYWTIGGFDGAKPLAQAMAEAKAMGYDGLELAFGAGCLRPAFRMPNVDAFAARLGN